MVSAWTGGSAVLMFLIGAATGTGPAVRVAIRQELPAIRVAIRQQFKAIRDHFRQFGCSVHAQNVGNSAGPAVRMAIRQELPAIRVAIRQQFKPIRDHCRQFGCSAHAQNVGTSAVRSPTSSLFKTFKGKAGGRTYGCTAPGATLLEFYHAALGEGAARVLEF